MITEIKTFTVKCDECGIEETVDIPAEFLFDKQHNVSIESFEALRRMICEAAGFKMQHRYDPVLMELVNGDICEGGCPVENEDDE